MKNNLIKLSLISLLIVGTNSALANSHDNDKENDNANEQEAIIYTQMGPDICPDEPHCPEIALLELEEDQ